MILKSFLLFSVALNYNNTPKTNKSRFLLSLVLIGAIIEDAAWALLVTESYFSLSGISLITRCLMRGAWVFYVIFYQSLALFVESLIDSRSLTRSLNIFFITVSSLFAGIFLYIALSTFYSPGPSSLQLISQSIFPAYAIFMLLPCMLWYTSRKLTSGNMPKLLSQQYTIIVRILIIPRIITDSIQYYPFKILPDQFTNSYAIIGLSSLALTIALFYCTKRIIGLRFLNLNNHVQSPQKFNFIDDFKDVLDQFSRVTTIKELGHITQTYFKESFSVPILRSHLYVRNHQSPLSLSESTTDLSESEEMVESFLSTTKPEVLAYLHTQKILIYDELDFTHFYEENQATNISLNFLNIINADIFIPIYKNQAIIAYIIVERNARPGEFYSNVERDEIVVFVSYIANIINLLQNRTLESLLHHEKELQEDLYKKHQEITHYKESIRSFLKQGIKDTGIIFYKSRRFSFANQAAQEIIGFNLNTHEGYALTKIIKRAAQLVEEYKIPQKTSAKDHKDNKITICAVPSLDSSAVIITVSYPDCTDVITGHLDQLKDPTKWDYLLYLETTKPGHLINQLIPSSGETLLNFKIALLELALSKKALLLEMAQEDLLSTVEIIHHISMRETLHILTLEHPVTTTDIIIKLFGAATIFGINQTEKPLFEKLHETGTLFIENIDLLDRESQEYLAEYIRYGYYRAYKSDMRILSSVRVICSTQKNIAALVQEGKFSVSLLGELKKASLIMPSLLTLPDQEISALAQGYSQQALQGEQLSSLIDLSERDTQKIASQKPASLYLLKQRVQTLLTQKSKKSPINHELHVDPAYDVTDPELVQAARLGKHALRDQRIMTLLWNKFKNQNQIAMFLNVNRSSVNRRCKEYNLE